ncbi:hypothetical protein LTR94_028288, partial [Friedmanniomyces endolithicus]
GWRRLVSRGRRRLCRRPAGRHPGAGRLRRRLPRLAGAFRAGAGHGLSGGLRPAGPGLDPSPSGRRRAVVRGARGRRARPRPGGRDGEPAPIGSVVLVRVDRAVPVAGASLPVPGCVSRMAGRGGGLAGAPAGRRGAGAAVEPRGMGLPGRLSPSSTVRRRCGGGPGRCAPLGSVRPVRRPDLAR